MSTSNKTALVLGATGMAGSACLNRILQSSRYSRVKAVVRKPLAFENARLQSVVVDFERLSEYREVFSADDVFCALGTTIRHAGSQEQFRHIDYDYPLAAAGLAAEHGAKQILLVSAVGANPKSGAFYLRVKGELEEAISRLPYRTHHFFRPAMLIGERERVRLREEAGVLLAKIISPILVRGWRKYRSVNVSDLATTMVTIAEAERSGIYRYASDEINEIAARNS